ncbi:MAG: ATP-dependent metallopeptidase FtsH/Yme1/Tma family protein [Candidatus Spechtbacteria bacterium]|nr:ATP-dependent metallopeptidase FtsH/Yme1/Tma family protein [Candidatus Spechtbacteria bacterium]
MSSLLKNIILVIIVFLFITGIFTLWYSPLQKTKDITLSNLVTEINEGKVQSITVNGNELSITLKDSTKEKSQKETDASLTQSLINYGVSSDNLRGVDIQYQNESGWAYWLGILIPFVLPFFIVGFFLWYMMRQAQRGSNQAMMFGKTSARMFGPQGKKQNVTFKDVADMTEAKDELKEVVEFLRLPQKFLKMGARIPRGVLLVGPPGTGKTLLARAISGEAGVPFFATSGSEFVEMFVGVGASRVRDLFQSAQKAAPAIVFIDEIDAVGRLRGAGMGGGNDEREQTLNQILSEMDGFERDTNVIVIAATNRADVLDPALLRPGRFDRHVFVSNPDLAARQQILIIHGKEKPLAKDVDLNIVAQRTPGFSGADLANLMNEAAILAAQKNQKTILQIDILNSIEKVMLGPEKKSQVYSKLEKEIAAYHEAGHALVSASLPEADPVHKISIIPRGPAGGYTLKLPIEDRHFYGRKHFVAELAVMLGGYSAEIFHFNEITTGASDDLKKASELARSMVTKYGMSKKFGPQVFQEKDETIFLGREFAAQNNVSQDIAMKIDEEVATFIRAALKTAQNIIKKRSATLDKIAQTLITQETIEKQEFAELVAGA